MANDPEIKDELDDAKEDLHDALQQVNNRVEEQVARLRPDRGIRKHPLTTACVVAAMGFSLGSESGEAALIGLLALGAALMFSRESKVDESVEIEPI